ncbi:hypothetical protein CHS0354_042622 [Potamilus streckersoni]|uniref:Ig-like domain-containing protein n=1 Tax=Potamilus streckersoni TaxID=2493646 RepID=A0AAE0WBZ5_9BIVA|nr:hypothetical protein CHS0354_042622 [Potamilus streckersoni]
MNCFLVSIILPYFIFSFGKELAILPSLKQYWIIKGSTLKLACIHNGTQASQEHSLSFWKSNTHIIVSNGVTVNTIAISHPHDARLTIRTLNITKSDVQFSDGGPWKCILGQNIGNFKEEAVIDVRVLEFQSAEYDIPDILLEDNKLIVHCNAFGVNPTDTNYTFTTEWRKVSEGKDQVLGNSSKYTIFTANRTLEIVKPLREDAGDYRCVLIFNKEDNSSCQEVRSQPFNVKAVPKIETHDKDKNMYLGETLELRCTTSGFPKPSITWMKNGTALNQTERIHPKEDKLVIYNLRFDDEGDYQCVASHPQFNSTDRAKMRVKFRDIKEVLSGGKGYIQVYLWTYILFLLSMLQCGLYAELML